MVAGGGGAVAWGSPEKKLGTGGPRGMAGAVLGAVYFEQGQVQTAAEHGPEYLRVSQAERERVEREKRAQEERR